jgi:hypothetical protein
VIEMGVNPLYDISLIVVGAIIGAIISQSYTKHNEGKKGKEKIDLIAPLIREELQENIVLCDLWRQNWNKFFGHVTPIKKFKNAKLKLYQEHIAEWSLKNDNKLYLVNELVNEINEILDTSQGVHKSVYPIHKKANDMKNLIINLPEPFKVNNKSK